MLLQGKGEGRLRLRATYWPFDLLYSKPREATMVRAMPSAPKPHTHTAFPESVVRCRCQQSGWQPARSASGCAVAVPCLGCPSVLGLQQTAVEDISVGKGMHLLSLLRQRGVAAFCTGTWEACPLQTPSLHLCPCTFALAQQGLVC